MKMKVKVAIAEDNQDLRESLKASLGYFSEVEVIFSASNGLDLVNKCTALQPQVILMDIEMPVMNGIEATANLKANYPSIKVLMLTVFDDDNKIMEAILAGANGYLLKEEHPRQIVDAIQDIMEGGAPMSPSIALKTLNILRHQNKSQEVAKSDFGISEREMQVLTRLAEGKNYNEVSESLFISPKTVRNHIQNIYTKLQVNSKLAAIDKARSLGWM
jgi:DNA-binding NarL/FixJ family response regulator